MDLEPSGLGSAAGLHFRFTRFFVDHFWDPFFDPFLVAFPALLGRLKNAPRRPRAKFKRILEPQRLPFWRPNWVPERTWNESQLESAENAKTNIL